MKAYFFRISKPESEEGLWYDLNGEFTGRIHTDFAYVNASNIEMPFDEEIVGWLSAADTLEHLYEWFPKENIKMLQKAGFYIYEYEVEDFKFYEKFNHTVINQATSKRIGKIVLL